MDLYKSFYLVPTVALIQASTDKAIHTKQVYTLLQAMIKLFDPFLTWAARRYQAAVATELKKYGLRYEDLYDPLLNMVRAKLCKHVLRLVSQHTLLTCLALAAFLHYHSVINCWLLDDLFRSVV